MNPKEETKKTTFRYITIKLLKPSELEIYKKNILKVARQMFHNITFKGTNSEVITDVFSETKQARRL